MSTTFHPSPRRPLPLRLESRRASILSLANFESNIGLQQPQVDLDLDHLDTLVDQLDDIDDLHAPDKLYDLEDFNL